MLVDNAGWTLVSPTSGSLSLARWSSWITSWNQCWRHCITALKVLYTCFATLWWIRNLMHHWADALAGAERDHQKIRHKMLLASWCLKTWRGDCRRVKKWWRDFGGSLCGWPPFPCTLVGLWQRMSLRKGIATQTVSMVMRCALVNLPIGGAFEMDDFSKFCWKRDTKLKLVPLSGTN